MGTKLRFIVVITFLLALLVMPVKVSAHGVDIEYTCDVTVEIMARYDTGEPMSEAQITVYTPEDTSTPWLTDKCDSEGHFSFTPDTSIPGEWKIKVRLAGHGDIFYIPVGESGGGSSNSSYSVLQIVLMSVCVVWGAVGTALFFARRRKA